MKKESYRLRLTDFTKPYIGAREYFERNTPPNNEAIKRGKILMVYNTGISVLGIILSLPLAEGLADLVCK